MLSGDLPAGGLPDLLRELADGGATGCLHVLPPDGEPAEVYLRRGRVHAVRTGGLPEGEALAPPERGAAVADLLRRPGRWRFRLGARARVDSAPLDVEDLLAEAAVAPAGRPRRVPVVQMTERARDDVDASVSRVTLVLSALLGPAREPDDLFGARPRPAAPVAAGGEPPSGDPGPALAAEPEPEPFVAEPEPEPVDAAPPAAAPPRDAALLAAFAHELSATASSAPLDPAPPATQKTSTPPASTSPATSTPPATTPPATTPPATTPQATTPPTEAPEPAPRPELAAPWGRPDTDTASLLRELSSLGLDDDPAAPAGPGTSPARSTAAAVAAAQKKRKGLFGRS